MGRILVIGDVMLDIYQYGEVERISPEAPVPIIHIQRTEKNLGGAGNTFANLYSIGADCFLMGVVGRDHHGAVELPTLIHDKYPGAEYYFHQSPNHPTIIKERVIARTQQICRLDWENVNEPLLIPSKSTLCHTLKNEIDSEDGCDVLIISDYAKGFINPEIMETIQSLKKNHYFKIILDPHPNNASIYHDIDYATPNQKEFDEIGIDAFWKMGCHAIIRTEGADGMTIIRENQPEYHLYTVAQKVYDVSGAGDTVSAVLGYMLSQKVPLIEAATIANQCAGWVVSQLGTIPIERKQFYKILKENPWKI